jgi:polyphosphate glucokinase
MEILGVDIGGSGIKGAPVDTTRGVLLSERQRIPTPHPSTPAAVARTVAAIAAHFKWKGPIGCGLPAVIRQHKACTAANISQQWLGVDVYRLFARATKCTVSVINDADAAGYAEMHFGAGRRRAGVVILVTLGTGIGTAVFVNGHLVPNTELGHLEIDGKDAEKWAADSVRDAKNLSWKKWSKRVDTYLQYLERYFWPDLFIIGGGVSKKADKFIPRVHLRTPIVPAKLLNDAGIVGAALAYVHEQQRAGQKLALG